MAIIGKKPWTIVTGFIWLAFLSCSQHNFSGIMSWQEYNSQPKENRYILELESEKGKLLYYGAFHSVNLPRIHRQLMDYRDQHMLQKLFKELGKGHRVFAVVGCSHVVMQEPVLRAKL